LPTPSHYGIRWRGDPGNSVKDTDGNALGYTISIDGLCRIGFNSASGRPTVGAISFTNKFALGEHVVNSPVSDGAVTETCATLVSVVDHIPPTIHCPTIS